MIKKSVIVANFGNMWPIILQICTTDSYPSRYVDYCCLSVYFWSQVHEATFFILILSLPECMYDYPAVSTM